jgi:heme/copper-type cytochrome/quinol oxidase subunit 4
MEGPMKEKKAAAFRQGIAVLVALAILTGIEYWVSIATGSVVFLFILALAKAGLILNYFMHMAKLWREEAH